MDAPAQMHKDLKKDLTQVEQKVEMLRNGR